MRAWLVACAALALAHATRAAAAAPVRAHSEPDPARLDHIKSQILAKLGLSARPTPLGAPPRDVVRQILARAADPQPPRHLHDEPSMREIIAIAHRGGVNDSGSYSRLIPVACVRFILSFIFLLWPGENCGYRWQNQISLFAGCASVSLQKRFNTNYYGNYYWPRLVGSLTYRTIRQEGNLFILNS